jgi:hypothetical protein
MKFNIFTAPLLDRLVDGAVVAHPQQEIATALSFSAQNKPHRLAGGRTTQLAHGRIGALTNRESVVFDETKFKGMDLDCNLKTPQFLPDVVRQSIVGERRVTTTQLLYS